MARSRSSRPTIFFISHLKRDCLPTMSAAFRTLPTHSNCEGRLLAGGRSTASILGWARKIEAPIVSRTRANPPIFFAFLLKACTLPPFDTVDKSKYGKRTRQTEAETIEGAAPERRAAPRVQNIVVIARAEREFAELVSCFDVDVIELLVSLREKILFSIETADQLPAVPIVVTGETQSPGCLVQ